MSVYKPKTSYLVTNHFAVLLVLLIIFVSVGYFLFLGRPEETAAHMAETGRLAEARARWLENAPAHYRYVVDRACDCPQEMRTAYTVTVTPAGRSASYPIPVEAGDGTVLTEPPAPVWLEDLFGLVDRQLLGGMPVNVTYHYLYGFPEIADLNPGSAAADSQNRYEIRDFEVIRSP